MGGDLFHRTMAMSRSTVVKTEISPSDHLGVHHIVDLNWIRLPMFASNLAVTMSVTAYSKIRMIKFTVHTLWATLV